MIDISEKDRRIILDVLTRLVPGVRAKAFGSRVHGRAKPWSDLDLALISDAPIPPETMMRIRLELSDSDLPWRVDVLDWGEVDDSFRAVVAGDLTSIN